MYILHQPLGKKTEKIQSDLKFYTRNICLRQNKLAKENEKNETYNIHIVIESKWQKSKFKYKHILVILIKCIYNYSLICYLFFAFFFFSENEMQDFDPVEIDN